MKKGLFYLFLVFSGNAFGEVLFSPNGCEFLVKFPDQPKFYQIKKATADGALVPLEGAQLTVTNGKGFIRSECGSMEGMDKAQLTDENLTFYMQQLGRDMGLKRLNYELTESSLGEIAILTGLKDSGRGRITVQVSNYFGSRSILTLYLMALSEDWQTSEMRAFKESVEKRD